MKSIYALEVGSELTRKRRKPVRKGLWSLYFQKMHWLFLIVSTILMAIAVYCAALKYGVFSFRFILVLVSLLILFRLAVVPLFQILKAYFPPLLRKVLTLLFTFIIVCPTGFVLLYFDQGIKQRIEPILTHFKTYTSVIMEYVLVTPWNLVPIGVAIVVFIGTIWVVARE